MGTYNGDNKRGGFKKSVYGNGRGGYRPNPVVVMHKATCAQCGKQCEVPFRPNGQKPIYCRDCFSGKKEDGFNESSAPRREFGNDRNDHRERPSYNASRTSREFTNSPAPVQDSSSEIKRHLVDIGNKLDRLLSVMEKTVVKTESVAEAAPKGPSLKSIVKKAVSKKKSK
jgi:CxxC-x17-CxxC domain-containing protein